MGNDWPLIPLEDLTETPITYGVVKPGEEDESGVLFVRSGDIADGQINFNALRTITREVSSQYGRTLLLGGELLISLVGSPGQVAIVPRHLAGANIARQVGLVRLLASVDSRFVKYFLLSPEGKNTLVAHSLGSVQQVINLRDLKTLKIPQPPLIEQQAIASILGALDDKIELNLQRKRTLEAMARALFQSWFVDFDPVKAKAAGKQPPGLKPEIAALFPIAMQESELGPIPKGWETVPLSDLATITMGLSPDSKSYNGAGVGDPLINGPVEFGNFFPVKTKWTEAATRFAVEHDLVFCVRGSTTGRRVIADGKYAIGRGVCAIRAQHNRHCFLYQTIDFGLNRLLAKATGSVFPSLSAPDIKGFHVLKPSSTLLDIYEKLAGPIINQVKISHYECRLLSEIRNELLPKLVSGTLRVAQVERILARAL